MKDGGEEQHVCQKGSMKESSVEIVAKIMVTLHVHAILTMACLFYPTTISEQHVCPQKCTPKRQRWWRKLDPIQTWLTRQANRVDKAVQAWDSKRCLRKRMSLANAQVNKGTHRMPMWAGRLLVSATLIAMQSQTQANYNNSCRFDTDSQQIGVDNRCSACMSH